MGQYDLDPVYAPAWHALARRYYGSSRYASGDPAMMDKWETAVKRVLALEPDNVDAHFTLSYALRYAGLLQDAARHCERALVLDAHAQTSGLRACAIPFTLLGDHPRFLTRRARTGGGGQSA